MHFWEETGWSQRITHPPLFLAAPHPLKLHFSFLQTWGLPQNWLPPCLSRHFFKDPLFSGQIIAGWAVICIWWLRKTNSKPQAGKAEEPGEGEIINHPACIPIGWLPANTALRFLQSPTGANQSTALMAMSASSISWIFFLLPSYKLQETQHYKKVLLFPV